MPKEIIADDEPESPGFFEVEAKVKKVLYPFFILFVILCTGLEAQEIHEAALKGDLVKIKTILEKNPESIHFKDQRGWAPLHAACFGGHLDIVKYLISRGADTNTLTDAMETALHLALHSNADPQKKKEIVELLISLNPQLVAKKKRSWDNTAHVGGKRLGGNNISPSEEGSGCQRQR